MIIDLSSKAVSLAILREASVIAEAFLFWLNTAFCIKNYYGICLLWITVELSTFV